ncbi:MAG: hypothetical protein GX153_08230 [Clostridiaceae bacterium]|jgi:hypothetical protein|nr:hypothetical protein [Clostridiaceae bacterium]
MLYFFLLLVIQCAVSVLLSLLLLHMVRNSLRNQVRRAWVYPLPSLLTILLIVFSLIFTIPSLLDAKQLVFGGLPTQTVTVEKVSGWNAVWVDGKRLSRAPWDAVPEEGGTYRMSIAPRSKTILRMDSSGNPVS